MTVTTPETGFRARLRRLTRRAVVLAMLLGVCGLGASSAVASADADAEEEAAAVELHLAAGAHGIVAPGSPFSTTVTVQNDSESELSAGRLLVELNRTPLADEAAVTTWLADEQTAGTFEPLVAEVTKSVEAGSAGSTSILLPAESLGDLAPGVYPLRAALSGATTGGADDLVHRSATTTSVLVVTAAQPRAAVLVPITATPSDGALLTLDELTALTAADGALTAQLDGVTGTSAVLAIDPAIPAAIRALGTSAPTQVTDWLERLDRLPNERFALRFADADAATQAHAGATALLEPTTLTPFLDPQNFLTESADETPAPTDTPSPEPTATATAGPQLPDDEELVSVSGALPGVLWPRADVTADDLAAFAGYVGDDVATIVPSTSVSGTTAGHATQNGRELLITAAAASGALSEAAAEPDADARQGWLAAANAHLFLSAQATGSAPVLLGLDRDETRTADALREAISTADSVGFDLTALRATPATEATLSATADASRPVALQGLLEDEAALVQFATLLEDPQVLLSPKRIQLLRVIGVGLTDAEFADAVTASRRATDDTLQAVSIPPSSTIQLLTANADLPFPVRNDLPWPVTIRLSVSPSDPRLDVQPVTEWVVQANTSVRVKVPVSARVGSGELDLRLHLSSPSGVAIGDQQIVRVAVRAEWESIGLAVFGGLIVLLIALGVIRTVRRKRQETRELGSDAVPDAVEERDLDGSPPPSKDGRE